MVRTEKRKPTPTDFMVIVGADFVRKYTIAATFDEFGETLRRNTNFLVVIHGETADVQHHAHVFFHTTWPHKNKKEIELEFRKTGLIKKPEDIDAPVCLAEWIKNSREKIEPASFSKVAKSMVCRNYVQHVIDAKFHPSTSKSVLHGLIHKTQNETTSRSTLCCFKPYFTPEQIEQKLKFASINKNAVKVEDEEEDEEVENDKENKEKSNPLFRLQLGNKSKCESFVLLKEYVDMTKAQDINEFTNIVPLQDRV